MTSPVLSIRGLSKRFGAHVVSDDINLELIEGEIYAVIGPNGAGKTTLMNQLIGELDSDAGTIIFEGRDITRLPTYERSLLGLSRSYQITSLFLDFTALENVSIAAQAHDGHSFGVWHPASREEGLTAASLESLQTVGLQDKANSLVSELAHGERRQVELAMALVSRSKVLLLDEPMAGDGHARIRYDSKSAVLVERQIHDIACGARYGCGVRPRGSYQCACVWQDYREWDAGGHSAKCRGAQGLLGRELCFGLS